MPKDFIKKHFIDDVKGSLRRGGGNAAARLQDKTFTENGVFKADEGYDGLREVTVLVEAAGGAGSSPGSGDVIEFDVLPETTVYYDENVSGYTLPCTIYHNFDTTYVITINGKTYNPYIFGANQGHTTFLGNSYAFGYSTSQMGTFGIMFSTGYDGLICPCLLRVDPQYFDTAQPITIRIYKLATKVDAASWMKEPYIDYILEDNTIDEIPNGAFYDSQIISAKSETVKYIADGAFNYNPIYAIDFPNVLGIGSNAFGYCVPLANVNLPLVEELSSNAFVNCWGLKNITFPALKYARSYCFSECRSLTVADFHSLEELDAGVFAGAQSLKVLIIRSESVCSLVSVDAFNYTPFDPSYTEVETGGILLVPSALIDAYWAETNWSAVMGSGYNMILPIEDFTVDGTVMGELGPNPNKVMNPGLYKEIPELNGAAMTYSWEELLDNELICVDNGVVYANPNGYSDIGVLDGILILPDDGSITAIGDAVVDEDGNLVDRAAFTNCYNLTRIDIPDSVTSFGAGAFNGCYNLTDINIPDGVTSIGGYAFCGCSSLASIVIPEGVTSIGEYAFCDCSSLTSITIPASVVSIGEGAFDSSAIATLLVRSESVCSLTGTEVFIDTPFDSSGSGGILIVPRALINAYRNDENWSAILSSTNNILVAIEELTVDGTLTGEFGPNPNKVMNPGLYQELSEFGTTAMTYSWEDLLNNEIVGVEEGAVYVNDPGIRTTLILPNDGSITAIGDGAFEDCSDLTSIAIPESVTTIGTGAFYNCYALTSIALPEGVTSIGEDAFYECTSLESMVIPEGVTSIGAGTFSSCRNITDITIPTNVTSIGAGAFYNTGLKSIVIPEGVTSIDSRTFDTCGSLKSVVIPDGVTSIGDSAFYRCPSLKSITLPEGVTTIGEYAFAECTALSSINIPEGVTSISAYMFSQCSQIAYLTLPEGVTTIGDCAFSGCTALSSINIPEGVTSIGKSAFNACDSLTYLFIPEGVTAIGEGAFNSSGLTSIVLNPGVTVIRRRTFRYTDLTSIIIPEGVTDIEAGAFYYCTSLESIVLPSTLTNVGGNDAFEDCRALSSITCLAVTPPVVTSYSFDGCTAVSVIRVPAESVSAYKSATGWGGFSSKIVAIE